MRWEFCVIKVDPIRTRAAGAASQLLLVYVALAAGPLMTIHQTFAK
jgi:hypothetical protein